MSETELLNQPLSDEETAYIEQFLLSHPPEGAGQMSLVVNGRILTSGTPEATVVGGGGLPGLVESGDIIIPPTILDSSDFLLE